MTDPSNDDRPVLLLVDDVPANLSVLSDALEAAAYKVQVATSGADALRIAAVSAPDLILLDVAMPHMDGYQVCRRLKAGGGTKDIPVIFITAYDQKTHMLEGFEAGGVDYITKPFAEEEVLVRVRTHLANSRLSRALAAKNAALEERTAELSRANARLRDEIDQRERATTRLQAITRREAERWGIEGFISQSPTIEKILQEIRPLQNADSINVLISGESGTGKELIARALHFGCGRAQEPFVPVNCGAIPAELAESALFGHVKGAFTGATADHRGYFELADGGTLFLDEIGDMPLDLQVKLLRVLEEGAIRPVGAAAERPVNVRTVAATNAELGGAIARGGFRQDLYFRLARFTVTLPPLRQRAGDIPLLVSHFVRAFAEEMRLEAPALSPAALASLQSYAFPGNVRELKNMIEHALLKSGGATIEPEHLHFLPLAPSVPDSAAPAAAVPQDEQRILGYVRQHGRINNAGCRRLLAVNRRRATYLLDKLFSSGQLERQGGSRHIYYTLIQ